jgi:hypothetical protein
MGRCPMLFIYRAFVTFIILEIYFFWQSLSGTGTGKWSSNFVSEGGFAKNYPWFTKFYAGFIDNLNFLSPFIIYLL